MSTFYPVNSLVENFTKLTNKELETLENEGTVKKKKVQINHVGEDFATFKVCTPQWADAVMAASEMREVNGEQQFVISKENLSNIDAPPVAASAKVKRCFSAIGGFSELIDHPECTCYLSITGKKKDDTLYFNADVIKQSFNLDEFTEGEKVEQKSDSVVNA